MGRQTQDCIPGPDWAAGVEKGHRDEVVAKEQALHPDERQHPRQTSGCIPLGKIQALVSENTFDHPAPPEQVAVSRAIAVVDELIPLVRVPGKGLDHRAAGTGLRRVVTVAPIGPKRNSRSNRSSLAWIRPRPV